MAEERSRRRSRLPHQPVNSAERKTMKSIVTHNRTGDRVSIGTTLPQAKKLRIIPIGGLGEVGKNCMALEYDDDIIVIDMGMMFPDETMPGIDLVIPDIAYLKENRKRVRGVIITHGHEDHIGAIPFLAPDLGAPVYAPQLAAALIESKLSEFPDKRALDLRKVNPDDKLRFGVFEVEYFRVNHSIPESFGLIIRTPEGTIVHTGDWKLDLTSPEGVMTDFHKLADVSKENPLLLLADSTNSEQPGYTISEAELEETFSNIFAKAKGRLIISAFASRIDRFQQVLSAAVKTGRKVTLSGRSLLNYFEIAARLGYLKYPKEILIPLTAIDKYPDDKVVILATGTQGQAGSALTRMAFAEHKQVKIKESDTVVLSASPIPGNEKAVGGLINNLRREGATVIYNKNMTVHVTGHAFQEEQKLMIRMVKPRFFIPVHGEYHMLATHRQTAAKVGVPLENSFIIENGDVIEFDKGRPTKLDRKVAAGIVMVDGIGVGDVGEIVLRDRQAMAKEGMIVLIATVDQQTGQLVSSPDIISRGFVYMREKEELINQIRSHVRRIISGVKGHPPEDWGYVKNKIREDIGEFIFGETQRRPMVLPVIIEV
jgi:ribonuclease J